MATLRRDVVDIRSAHPIHPVPTQSMRVCVCECIHSLCVSVVLDASVSSI